MSFSLLAAGFALGALHALDADHIMAVSALSATRTGNQASRLIRQVALFAGHWALGHGLVLMLAGVCLFTLDIAIPAGLQQAAEILVGIVLILIGLSWFWQLYRQKLVLTSHQHGAIHHTHWHVDDGAHTQRHGQSDHAPVLVGMLHGLAGSAPALVLIPVVLEHNIFMVLGYLLLFSAGVSLSMVVFGLCLASIQSWLKRKQTNLFTLQRHLIAIGSVVAGSIWLLIAW